MTTAPAVSTSTDPHEASASAPPLSRAVRLAAGAALCLGGLLNGLPPYLFSLLVGEMSFVDQVQWGVEHPTAQWLEQTALVVSALFMPLGLLGLAQVTRWRSRRLTAVAAVLVLWGMWGFHNILSMGYVAGTVAPQVIPIEHAVDLNDALPSELGVVVMALVPHLVGSFLGVLLLTVAAWRSGVFPRAACVLVAVFLVWDFFLPMAGALEPHLLLVVGWVWMGLTIMRMGDDAWRGGRPS